MQVNIIRSKYFILYTQDQRSMIQLLQYLLNFLHFRLYPKFRQLVQAKMLQLHRNNKGPKTLSISSLPLRKNIQRRSILEIQSTIRVCLYKKQLIPNSARATYNRDRTLSLGWQMDKITSNLKSQYNPLVLLYLNKRPYHNSPMRLAISSLNSNLFIGHFHPI